MPARNENNLHTHQHSGSVAPTPSGMSRAIEDARQFTRSAELPEITRYQFLIVVEELITNIVTHGMPNEDTSIDYEFARLGDGVRIAMSDGGVPFDPTSLPRFAPDAAIEAGKEGGWGWPVILNWCELETFHRVEDRNHVALLLHPGRSADWIEKL